MPRDSYSTLKTKIEKEILKLQKKAHDLHVKRRIPVIESIIRSMREYDISPQEIIDAYGRKKPAKTARAGTRTSGTKATAKKAVQVKYRHPDTGETWTGRGKSPRWILAAEAEGRKRDEFLVV
jgi:DNA-binding protein H-NS